MIVLYLLLLLGCVALAVSSLLARTRGWTPPVAPSRAEGFAAWGAFLVAVAVSLAMIFLPLVSTQSTGVGFAADTVAVEQRRTLLESGGAVILPLLAVVVAIAAVPIALRRRGSRYWIQLSAALVLAALSLLAGFSIGPFLLPIAALMFLAALAARVAHRTR